MPIDRRSIALLLLVVFSAIPSGCYTRLTTAKEARSFRDMYSGVDQAASGVVELDNARANLGNTFIMTLEAYLEAEQRFRSSSPASQTPSGLDPHRFRPGSKIDIRMPGHPDDPINQTYVVRNEGTIDLPVIPNYPVAGRTADEIRDDLRQKLRVWYMPYPPSEEFPAVTVNIPIFEKSLTPGNVDLGSITTINLGSGGTTGGASGGTLKGNDTFLSVVGQTYSAAHDWNDYVVLRKIRSQRVKNGAFFEYYIMILVDFEEMLYRNPNLNFSIQDGDVIISHPERSPLILELVQSAAAITGVHGTYIGFEEVLRDIFGSK